MYNSFGETLANEWTPKTVCESRADWLKFEDLSNRDQLVVSLPKLEPSLNVSSSFLMPRWVNVTQWSNYLTQRAKISTQRSNLTPERAKNAVNDLPVVPKSLST